MTTHSIVSQEEWTRQRRELLVKEKEFTRLRDELSQARRDLPWERVTKAYDFDGPNGKVTLAEAFDGRSQLVVYHFMFAPEWENGCKSCSFWADNFNGIVQHLNQRDVSFAAISRAPLAKLLTFADRLGWSFKWLSSEASDFNYDYNVSFRPQDLEGGKGVYNYAPLTMNMTDLPGVSVFYKDADGAIYHTYSAYSRGIDILNTAYNYLDIVPKGRDEADLSHPMAWVRLHDQYAA
ncbi:DUF899 domain-containing protein [Mesorhizobium sp. ANAO-SY3R2]|uniref:DUF899 domain-containing protein n=1 Tax=Mesorhizobium sp. ANAO-SY3R2 TaxID=3166644 RepID=UPI00366BA829